MLAALVQPARSADQQVRIFLGLIGLIFTLTDVRAAVVGRPVVLSYSVCNVSRIHKRAGLIKGTETFT